MKKLHIILLVILAIAFAAIVSSISDSTSYVNFEEATKDYERLMKLNKHIDELFKKKSKLIKSLGKK